MWFVLLELNLKVKYAVKEKCLEVCMLPLQQTKIYMLLQMSFKVTLSPQEEKVKVLISWTL